MTIHMVREIENLKKKILELGGLVEQNVHLAVQSLETRDSELAQSIINADLSIDDKEVELEEECLKLLALHQPVAIDLRFVVAVLKINNDLERISDLAVNIAERALFLNQHEKINIPFDFFNMVEKTKIMLRKSLDALVNMDPHMAHEVLASDDEVDAINRQMYKQVQDGILQEPSQIERLIHYLSTSRHLERIADHATNIAEDVIYMVDGEIVRHRAEDYMLQRN